MPNHAPPRTHRPLDRTGGPSLRLSLTIVLATATALFLIRLTGAPDMADNDQLRPASYTLDVVLNGDWIVQRDFEHRIASKPPLTVWISAVAAHLTGDVSRFALALPGFLGVAGLACLAVTTGHRRISPHAGLAAGVLLLACITGEKLVALVRTDGFFAFTVALTALAVLHAREHRGTASRWLPVYLLAGIASIAKSPIAVPLALAGLLGTRLSTAPALPRPRRASGQHALGLAVFLSITAGWSLAAYAVEGTDFTSKVFGDELVGHAIEGPTGARPFTNVYKAPFYFLAYYAPLSVLAVVGLVQCLREPAADITERRLERFLACWFLGGLTVFAIAPHQRPDLLAPLWLPAAVLAGREVHRIAARFRVTPHAGHAVAACVILLSLASANRYVAAERKDITVAERLVNDAATLILSSPLADEPMLHTTDPHLLRYALRRHATSLTPEDAAAELAATDAELLAVGEDRPEIAAALTAQGLSHRVVLDVPTPRDNLSFQIWRVTPAAPN